MPSTTTPRCEGACTPTLPADLDLYLQRQADDGTWSEAGDGANGGDLDGESISKDGLTPGHYRLEVHNWAGRPATRSRSSSRSSTRRGSRGPESGSSPAALVGAAGFEPATSRVGRLHGHPGRLRPPALAHQSDDLVSRVMEGIDLQLPVVPGTYPIVEEGLRFPRGPRTSAARASRGSSTCPTRSRAWRCPPTNYLVAANRS